MHRFSLFASLSFGLLACAAEPSSTDATVTPLAAPTSYTTLKASQSADTYLVVLKDAAARGVDIAARHRATVLHHYSSLRGFAATMSDDDARALAADPEVASVEKNATFRASAIQANATWGIDRIDQRALPLDGRYDHTGDGAGATAFIIDTGLRSTHVEFTGRVLAGATAIDDGNGTEDCNGHGTHVSGTVAGTTFGVAKLAKVVPIRVLGCDGSGSTDGIIAALDFVAQNHPAGSVANMSLGGGASPALDAAVRNLVASGVTLAVAAGNEAQDACNTSPAREPAAITVGATDVDDNRSDFSNFGSCVDISGPGTDITSAWLDSDTAINTISGTSMATPHVTGVAALVAGANPAATPAQVSATILAAATPNAISDLRGSPNKLLFSKVGDLPPPPPPAELTIKITSPGNGSQVATTFDVNLAVSTNATHVLVALDGTQVGDLPAPTPGFSLNNVAPGQHTIQVAAVDDANNEADDGITVTVAAAGGGGGPTGGGGNPLPPPPPPVEKDHGGGCSAGGNAGGGAALALALAAVLRRRRR